MITPLPWDSAHFGFAIARIDAPPLAPHDVAGVVRQSDDAGVRCLYLLADGAASGVWREAVRNGFEPIDVRMEFRRAAVSNDRPVDLATAADADALAQLAGPTFATSRFFVDERFPRERSESLFAIWARNGVTVPGMFTVVTRDEGGRIVAFVSCRLREEGEGSIDLVAVAPDARSGGVGRALVEAAVSELARRGCATVSVVTQGANVAAQALYQRAGFNTRGCGLWLHRWSS